jgi:hypothetical protein
MQPEKCNKRIAILQSNYIPWKGYFDIINSVDEFVIYDDAQYTRRDWRNRNLIKTKQGLKWLTIPVEVKGQYYKKIKDIKVANNNWPQKHWESIRHNYSKAPFFKKFEDLFEENYRRSKELNYLSEINLMFLKVINSILGIETKITENVKYASESDKSKRILSICKQLDTKVYLTGPSASDYLDKKFFSYEGIKIVWADYKGYPEYKQLYPPFEHNVSILDLIFNTGGEAQLYMKSFK